MAIPSEQTLRSARDHYFAVNRFGPDGGYDKPFVEFKLGPIPLAIPNGPSRVRAVRYHDLHHVVTGYGTDPIGEFEIAAWELGAGCRAFPFAFGINLAGLAGGAVRAPRRTFRAYVRGRASRSLYGQALESLLDQSVSAVQDQVGVARSERARAGLLEVVCFAALGCAGLVVGAAMFVGGFLLVPVALAYAHFARQPIGSRT
jgi:hypothetical protein